MAKMIKNENVHHTDITLGQPGAINTLPFEQYPYCLIVESIYKTVFSLICFQHKKLYTSNTKPQSNCDRNYD